MGQRMGSPRVIMAAAMAFAAATFNAIAGRQQQRALLASKGIYRNEATSGAHNYRGGAGTAAFRRAALKKRNQVRNRAAHRG
jgi:hypothetical protein